MLNCTDFYFFSPTGGTKRTGEIFCRAISGKVREYDLCRRDWEPAGDEAGDLSVIAVPVYGGRVPSAAAERIKKLNGAGRRAVTLAVYGVRAYEDALLELNQTAESQGFQIVASAALVAEHSIVRAVGAGRPDEADAREICEFAHKVEQKLSQSCQEVLKVPGNEPYKAPMKVTATPLTTDGCTKCGSCAKVCPTGAITLDENGIVTDLGSCILCMACVAHCPQHARMLPAPMQEALNQKLGALKDVHRENEYFL